MNTNADQSEPLYYTTADVAERFRLSPETVKWWRWQSGKSGPPKGPQGWVRVEGRWLLPRAALLAYESTLSAK